jgi:hypothetical protein
MKRCPYCDYSNYDSATVCRKCDASFLKTSSPVYRSDSHRIVSTRARSLRSHALSLIVLGLLVKVYWGGYGPWPTIDHPVLVAIRGWLEPLLLYGGAALYLLGWVLRFV